MSILVLNAGSTSLKFGLFELEAQQSLLSGSLDWADGNRAQATFLLTAPGGTETRRAVSVPDHPAAARYAIAAAQGAGPISVVGHRVVHGGARFSGSARVDAVVKAIIQQLAVVAPLHNPPALEAIRAVETLLPGVPQVAVFDTAFFSGLPPRAQLYPLPYEWYERWGVRRIGFHGISNQYCAGRAAEMLPAAPEPLRLITCHLGGGCSATAVRGGQPIATTMGFSPLEGLMMGSRCGSMDPGLLLHLQRDRGLSLQELDHALNHQSGLLGVSGLSTDLAQIEVAARQGHARAQLAFDLFADKVRAAIGSLAVTLGGVDALIFTDRIGEGSPGLRAAVCQGLECLGIRCDAGKNEACHPDADIAARDSSARILVIHTREELMIARETARVAKEHAFQGDFGVTQH